MCWETQPLPPAENDLEDQPPPLYVRRGDAEMESDSLINADHVLPANIETKSILLLSLGK